MILPIPASVPSEALVETLCTNATQQSTDDEPTAVLSLSWQNHQLKTRETTLKGYIASGVQRVTLCWRLMRLWWMWLLLVALMWLLLWWARPSPARLWWTPLRRARLRLLLW